MEPPKEPTKPCLETDAALAASAANAVEQWRTYQNAYTLYQQQYAAYEEYMRKQATLSTYEEQQAAYNEYLQAHNGYQSQLEQYEHQKVYQDYYAATGEVAPVAAFYPTTTTFLPTAMAVPPPVFTTPLANVDAFYNQSQDHYRDPSTLKHKSDASVKRSKVYTTTNFYANPDDEELFPADLKQLFEPLNCGLCKSKMNSHISANVHYQSKVHERKIIQWLQDYCERTGTPMPYRAKRRPVQVEPVGPNSLRCDACDLPLTSIQHANQHYTGKRHQMVVRGRKTPAGRGYYNKEGVWTRVLTDTDEAPERFGIGQSFAKQKTRYNAKDAKRIRLEPPPSPPPGVKEIVGNVLDGTVGVPAIIATVQPDTPVHAPSITPSYAPMVNPTYTPGFIAQSAGVSNPVEAIKTVESEIQKKESADCVDETGVFCKVCQIAVTSTTVMETHLKGVKHLKKLKSMGRMLPINDNGNAMESILSTLNKPPQQYDWSLYRMPSGKYYCKSCNSILADEKLFSQHWYSKKHKLKVKQEMDELSGKTETKPFYNKRPFGKGRFVKNQ
ncbi:uncharacterized protein LOC131694221 [Topomyia yanbarensis]|uniref:uncharacterized protein LOC131694221 n=1 Tax=Topomyia yanbarensis TaxID=2498891 RepID=UPI00273B5695|nr:uncharacterized protein LOC131694221 [Topomyia yanbarensis]XP_058838720.1 uncharacterized protein LOC131694221 [Topomyia yanbarensis]XP_058838721.1 uncharacterized protein LOC131694221 [Topomyia yanbarensis]XP_058838722.1 uncharacterized protein LOC131694221 [Topomyia yanbarensis]